MDWIKNWMCQRFSSVDIGRGLEYYRQGRAVILYRSTIGPGLERISGSVKGSKIYSAELLLDFKRERVVAFQCDCPRYEDSGFCKHIASLLFALMDENRDDGEDSSWRHRYADGSQFIRSYLERSKAVQEETPVRLQLQLESVDADEYPKFRLSVGQTKMYLVKNIRELVSRITKQETVSYGKNLTVCHRLENFDEASRKLLELVMDQYPAQHTGMVGYWREGYGYGGRNDRIQFSGLDFDRLFQLLQGQAIPWPARKGEILFQAGDPEVAMVLRQERDGAVLMSETQDACFFGNQRVRYAIQGNRLHQCSPGFSRDAYPLVHRSETPMYFPRDLLPTLSGDILTKMGQYIALEDPDGIVAQYQPEPCTPCFYFDWEEEQGLSLRIRYRYGTEMLDKENSDRIRRDLAAENRAAQLAQRYLVEDQAFVRLSREDQVMTLLTETIAIFQQHGEVYLSEQLKRKQIRPKQQPTVGVSVSNGTLTLNLDTGEFPAEELDALYESLLKKKKYHRLPDGRFLTLDGSGYELLAQAAHMMQLKGKDLRKGQVTMPVFRGLYLQELLGDQNEVVFRRDAQYRQLIRDFKTVEDSDYPIPEEMENVLRPYQATGFRWLKTLERNGFGGLLADEMGLGKTVQMIAYLMTVPRAQTGKPSLVVCPASLILNWGEEMARFAPTLNTELIMGNSQERKAQRQRAGEADVWITSYDLLKRDIEDYADLPFYACILDEGQNIKNQSTQASRAVKQIDCAIRFVLTGTPIENRLSELWNLFDFLMPGYLFSHNAFVSKLEKPIVKSGDAGAMQQLRRLVQPFILRRLKKDVLRELPEKMEYQRKISLSEEERKVYQAAARNALTSASQTTDKLRILALLTQLRQLCCDPNLCFENYQGQTSKLDACMELCTSAAANGHQILLFSKFTSMLDRIREKLEEMKISNQMLIGATPKEKRAQLVKQFQDGQFSVFLISLKAGGTGLNLTNADVVIHYDPWWNLSAQNQATDRAHRIGQKNCVQVYKLIAQGTVEEKILELQEKKAELTNVLSGEDMLEPLSREELMDLLA